MHHVTDTRYFTATPVKDIRQLDIAWPLPPQDPLYLTKPCRCVRACARARELRAEHSCVCLRRYVSHLVGHEGPGSVLSLLKAKGCVVNAVAVSTVAHKKHTSDVHSRMHS